MTDCDICKNSLDQERYNRVMPVVRHQSCETEFCKRAAGEVCTRCGENKTTAERRYLCSECNDNSPFKNYSGSQ